MAPRRWCRNRIRSVGCPSASEFRRFPISAPAAWAPCAAGRHHRGRLLLPTSLGDAREVTRPPGRAPACPSGRVACGFHPSTNSAISPCVCGRQRQRPATASGNLLRYGLRPTQDRLRYIRYANTQGERGKRGKALLQRQRQRQLSLRGAYKQKTGYVHRHRHQHT